MAEIVGLVASIMTIVEIGAKVATTLGKLSVQLRSAGKRAKDIAKKVKLVSTVLKQIEVKLSNGGNSIDLSLVEDYVLICEERMKEANRLIEVLEIEMKSPRNWDRAMFRIRFILEKSTFTLLQQDMDSLHLTLDLYFTLLTYEQGRKNEVALEEIQERLAELKQEVQDDILIRTASASVNAAVLTVQYNNFFPSPGLAPSYPSSSEAVVEEPTSEDDGDEVESRNHSTDQSLSLLMSRNNMGASGVSQPISPNMLDNEIVSEALVSFTQIRMVQKKTLRRVDIELERNSEILELPSSTHAPAQGDAARDQPRYSKSNIGIPIHGGDGAKNKTLNSQGDASYTHETLSGGSSNPVGQPFNEPMDTQSAQQISRETLAHNHRREYFGVFHCNTQKLIQISFASLKTFTLPDIILDIHSASLRYYPDSTYLNDPSLSPKTRDRLNTENEPLPAYNPRIWRTPRSPPESIQQLPDLGINKHRGNLTGYYKDIIRSKKTEELNRRASEYQKDAANFAARVISYAQKHTDCYKLVAIINHEFLFEIINDDGRRIIQHVPVGEEYEHLQPGSKVAIHFIDRHLIGKNMITIRNNTDKSEQKFVKEGSHSEDLKRLGELENYTYEEG